MKFHFWLLEQLIRKAPDDQDAVEMLSALRLLGKDVVKKHKAFIRRILVFYLEHGRFSPVQIERVKTLG